jgi:spore coat protein A
MISRRQFLKGGAVGGAALLVPWEAASPAWAAIPGGSLDPTTIPKYAAPLVIPPVMPPLTGPRNHAIDRYAIAVRQFRQQILPPGLPATTVWSYGSAPHRQTFNYPAFTIEATVDRPVRVKWINDLVDRNGRYLPHLLPVDPTLHWANPPGGPAGRDSRPTFAATPGPYAGPVPIVTHLHGGHSTEESDGFAEAWYLPHATNIPAGYARVGSFYEEFRAKFKARWHQGWPPGTAVFQYQNDQRASTMWFHDHTLGMTRVNVYAGPAGFYLLRGGPEDLPAGVLPGPAPRLGDPPGARYYEIPLVVQDRSSTWAWNSRTCDSASRRRLSPSCLAAPSRAVSSRPKASSRPCGEVEELVVVGPERLARLRPGQLPRVVEASEEALRQPGCGRRLLQRAGHL